MPADTLSPAEALAQAKAAAGIHTFVLKDNAGDPHTYNVTPHGLDGADWCLEVAAIIGIPLARLAQGHLLELFQMFMGDESIDDIDMEAIVKKLDGDGELNLSASAEDLFNSLRSLGSARLATLLKHTTRDGVGLNDDQRFADAYAANWGEWRNALVKVFKINRFQDFAISSSDSASAGESQPQE